MRYRQLHPGRRRLAPRLDLRPVSSLSGSSVGERAEGWGIAVHVLCEPAATGREGLFLRGSLSDAEAVAWLRFRNGISVRDVAADAPVWVDRTFQFALSDACPSFQPLVSWSVWLYRLSPQGFVVRCGEEMYRKAAKRSFLRV